MKSDSIRSTEAGARVKLRQTTLPEELTEVQEDGSKFIVHRMEKRHREPTSSRRRLFG